MFVSFALLKTIFWGLTPILFGVLPEEPEPRPGPVPAPAPPTDGTGTGASGGGGGYATPYNGTRALVSINQSTKVAYYNYGGGWTGNTIADYMTAKQRQYSDGVMVTGNSWGNTNVTNKSWSGVPGTTSTGLAIEADNAQLGFRNGAFDNTEGWIAWAELVTFKSHAITATASAPTSENVAATTADIICNFYVNTLHSDATCWLEYKKTTDSTWTTAGATVTTYGYDAKGIGRSLTGLSPLTQYQFRLQMTRTTVNETTLTSATSTFTTLANTPTLTTQDATNLTAHSATLNGTVNPNSLTTDVYLEWGTTSGSYPNSQYVATYSDSSNHNVSVDVSGLAKSTNYYFKVKGIVSGTTYEASNEKIATTLTPTTPDVYTSAASSVAATTATLNGILYPYAFSTTYYFQYGLTTSYGSVTGTQGPVTDNGPLSISAGVTGLSSTTLYHFRLVAVYNSTNYYGADMTFTTGTSPSAEAANQDHLGVHQLDRRYGIATTITFPLYDPRDVDSDLFFTGTAPVASEITLFKDYTASGNSTNGATHIGHGLFSLALSASEMSADEIDVLIHSATAAYRDVHIQIRTKWVISQIAVDASNITGGNALKLTGGSGGKSISAAGDIYSAGKVDITTNLAVGGNLAIVGNESCVNLSITGNHAITGNLTAAAITASGVLSAASIVGPVVPKSGMYSGTATGGGASTITLDTDASSVNDFYNGTVILITGSTGVGQARQVIDYDGATRRATVHAAWFVNPQSGSVFLIVPGEDSWGTLSAELTAIPLAADNYGLKIQGLYQYLFMKHVHTRTDLVNGGVLANQNHYQVMYKSDDTVLGKFLISDAGSAGGTYSPTIPGSSWTL